MCSQQSHEQDGVRRLPERFLQVSRSCLEKEMLEGRQGSYPVTFISIFHPRLSRVADGATIRGVRSFPRRVLDMDIDWLALHIPYPASVYLYVCPMPVRQRSQQIKSQIDFSGID